MSLSRLLHLVEIDAVGTGLPTIDDEHDGINTGPMNDIGTVTLAQAASTVRLADGPYTSDAGPHAYRAALLSTGPVRREMPLEPASAEFVGATWGTVRAAADPALVEQLRTYAIDGQTVRILRGQQGMDPARGILLEPAYAAFNRILKGIALSWEGAEDAVTIPVRDVSFRLERPLHRSFYAGTGGLEGTEDIGGRARPICLGYAQNVTPQLVDPIALIYQVNAGPAEVLAVYERGVAFSTPYAAAVTDLYTGTTPPGTVRTHADLGLFQLGSPPQGEITATVRGHFPRHGYIETPAAMARCLLLDHLSIGEDLINTTAFSVLAAATPYVSGVYWPDRVSGVEALGAILRSIGACLVMDRAGRLMPVRLTAPAGPAAAAYDAATIVDVRPVSLPATLWPPNYRRAVGWSRNYSPQDPDLDAAVTPARRQWLREPYRYSAFFDGDVRLRHARAQDGPAIESTLLSGAAARSVADALGALWGAERFLFDVSMPLHDPAWDLGDTILVDYPAGALDGGALCRVVGEEVATEEHLMTVRVLA